MNSMLFGLRMALAVVLVVVVLYIGPRRQPRSFLEVLNDQ